MTDSILDGTRISIEIEADEQTDYSEFQDVMELADNTEVDDTYTLDDTEAFENDGKISTFFEYLIGVELSRPQYIPIAGIESVSASVSKDGEDVREVGDRWRKEKTSRLGADIALEGHKVSVNGNLQAGIATLQRAADSTDDVRKFRIKTATEEGVTACRVASRRFRSRKAEKLKWNATLQQQERAG